MTTTALRAEVESGGRPQGRPGVHLSCERLQMFAPTPQDLELAEAVSAAGVEYVALSFVRRAADVVALREVVGDRAGIVAKIETASALGELAAITEVADALMVARGDLGIDCPPEDVPHLQKQIIRHCVSVGTPVITATQMLETMIDAPAPTRAEVSDVANAVFDGTDARRCCPARRRSGTIRCSWCRRWPASRRGPSPRRATSSGRSASGRSSARGPPTSPDRITLAVSHAAWQAAHDAGATAILCCTRSGRTARAIARFRPECRLVGLSPDPRTVNALALLWGVESVQVETYTSSDEMVWFAVETALQHGFIEHGDIVLVLAGAPDRQDSAVDGRAAGRPGRVTTALWAEEAGEPARRSSPSCTVRSTARPAC